MNATEIHHMSTKKTTTTPTATAAPADAPRPRLLPGSTMAALHRSNGPIGAALSTLAEWVEVAGHLAHLEAQRPARRNVATLEVEAEAKLMEVIEARQTVDMDELAAHAVAVQASAAAQVAVNSAFENVAVALAQRLDEIVRENADELHDHLTAQIREVISQARGHAGLLGTNAEAAIATGQVEAWQQMQTLREQYASLRGASGTLRRRLGGDPDHPEYPELVWISNPLEVFPRWRDWKAGARVNEADPNSPRLSAPWPTGPSQAAAAWFACIVNHPAADPWCPSPTQLDEAGAGLAAHHYREWYDRGRPDSRGRPSSYDRTALGPKPVLVVPR